MEVFVIWPEKLPFGRDSIKLRTTLEPSLNSTHSSSLYFSKLQSYKDIHFEDLGPKPHSQVFWALKAFVVSAFNQTSLIWKHWLINITIFGKYSKFLASFLHYCQDRLYFTVFFLIKLSIFTEINFFKNQTKLILRHILSYWLLLHIWSFVPKHFEHSCNESFTIDLADYNKQFYCFHTTA